MCQHCLRLFESKAEIPGCYEGLKDVLAAIPGPECRPLNYAILLHPRPSFDDHILQLTKELTDHLQGIDRPFVLMRFVEAPPSPDQTAARVSPRRVAYLANGLIDWSRPSSGFEADKELEVKVPELDFDRALPSNLNPHYHLGEDPDCVMVGHRCNCPQCQELSPTRKQKRESVAAAPFKQLDAMAIAVPPPQPVPAPAADIQTVDWSQADLRVPGSLPPLGLVVSENLRTAIETVDDTADAPAPASKENAASSTATGNAGSPDEKGSDNDAQPK